ncbi:prephenate dehydratase [Clostridium kluyveri]|uniref:Bifunctional chorismate mutase/prephenate dehydratase n=1 Tax=Clostridium kluyveri TaxID=1534 RepID=A0A1L5F5P4_CLOKL|nr:prephenate dehydratase [Clostridium kluyveri]APM38170.1 chorismate mutase [Clostridium kluyveri]UZQ51820.1 prephenate dehydratase [Clostridium kluyveri]
MDNLDYLRDKIDKIDGEMIKLFQERMDVVYKVAEYKKEKGMDILDKSREENVIKTQLKRLENKSIEKEAGVFLKEIMKISRNFQKKSFQSSYYNNECLSVKKYDKSCRVGFQGVLASFSYEALIDYFGHEVEAVNFETFKDVFQGLKDGKINYGVLPIENSSTGGILEVYDLLRDYGFYIVGEKCIKVNHNLLGVKGASLNDVKEVYSHSQAFMQSSKFLDKHENWCLIPYFNTARSAKYISEENDKSRASIASKKAAELYGLEILSENINYNTNNYTRFIIISRNEECNKDNDKISILITLPHEPGSLYKVLKYFNKNNLNMTKIESRPMVDRSWEYFFYIDFYGSILEENTKEALKGIESESVYFKLLGKYKGDCII